MRLVLDTNGVLSGLLWRGEIYEFLLQIRQTPSVKLFSSESLIEEFADVLARPHCVKRLALIDQNATQMVGDYLKVVELVEPANIAPTSRDVDDDAVLACALAARADFIVSGDQDLIVLGEFQNIPIISAADGRRMIIKATA